MAAEPGDPFNLGRVGYLFRGDTPTGGQMFWAGSQYRLNGVWQWCVNEDLNPPHRDTDSFVAAGSLQEPSVKVAGYELTRAQMAWLLNTYNSSNDPLILGGLSILVHANFEQPDRRGYPAAMSGVGSAQELASLYVDNAEKALPEVVAMAKKLATEAINSGVKGYVTNTVAGADERAGSVTGFAIKNGAGAYISGVSITATLTGPAVWDETAQPTVTFTTADQLIVKNWHATGNGVVSYTWKYVDTSGRLIHLTRANSQDTVQWQESSTQVVVPGTSWHVVFDFKPAGESHVGSSRVLDGGGVPSDTFTTYADRGYGSGTWLSVHGKPVSVVYRADLYRVPASIPANPSASVPQGAVKIASVPVTATAPGQKLLVKAPATQPAGFYVWVWQVAAADQQAAMKPYIKAGFTDGFAAAHEQTSIRFTAQVDSALSVRDTKAGQYLVDDVWVRGLPHNHPNFRGGAGFAADTGVITHRVLFFPFPLAVTEAHRKEAVQVGEVVRIPAKNGFYPAVGDPSWLLKVDEQGKALPGTYAFVSEFAGDDRVQPLATSVEDVTEQFVVPVVPSIHTTLTFENQHKLVPNFGMRTLSDVVAYTNLIPGKEYALAGTLMDKATGKVVRDSAGKPIEGTTV
ncbi:MAG: VaFE repeat-containing surface-anchored protein, partial [Arcanobacterium sp.]|nr:VaFE repeat-containing surface-anchored protein [Arcanobacterium sp.]